MKGAAAGSWSLGIVEQSQGEGCYWLRRDGLRGCEGGDWWERPVEESWAAMEQGKTAESCIGGGAIPTASLSPMQ